jgi:hypothetical protein
MINKTNHCASVNAIFTENDKKFVVQPVDSAAVEHFFNKENLEAMEEEVRV